MYIHKYIYIYIYALVLGIHGTPMARAVCEMLYIMMTRRLAALIRTSTRPALSWFPEGALFPSHSPLAPESPDDFKTITEGCIIAFDIARTWQQL